MTSSTTKHAMAKRMVSRRRHGKHSRRRARRGVGAKKRFSRSRKAKAAAPKVTTFQKDNVVTYRAGRSNPRRYRLQALRAFGNQNADEFVYEATLAIDQSGAANSPQKIALTGMFGIDGAGGSDGSADVADFMLRRAASFNSILHGVNGSTTASLSGDTPLAFKTLLMKCRERITIQNQDSAPINVMMFRCYPRKDVAYDQDDGGTTLDSFRSFYASAFGAAFQGGTSLTTEDTALPRTATTATASLTSQYAKNITPFQSTLFCRQYKIKEVRNLHVPAGEFVEVDHTETPMRVLDYARFPGILQLRGVGCLTVLLMHNRAWSDASVWTNPNINVTRTYSFKMIPSTTQRRLLTYTS